MKAIQANPQPLRQIFNKSFVIPEFQRPYSWEEEQCDQLWDDLAEFCENSTDKDDQYFLGSIVIYPDDKRDKTWRVVDGQQRLTTLMILIKVLFERAITMAALKRLLHKTDPITDEILPELRLESLVQAGTGRDDAGEFRAIILGEDEADLSKSKFKQNYDYLKGKVGNLVGKNLESDKYKHFISTFCDNVALLPIECNSMEDALGLFQIINDRGMQLSDADIFKAKIYGVIGTKEDQESFVKGWGNLKNHDDLFRMLMHIYRAEKGDDRKEMNLRTYILDNVLMNPTFNWNEIMRRLEFCNWLSEKPDNICDEESDDIDSRIYWEILERYTNSYWKYPVLVFLHKHMKSNDVGGYNLPKDKQANYLVLLKDTVRYFFIKGLVYNNVNRVRDTTYRVCVAIEKDRDYSVLYNENIYETDRGDITALEARLRDCDYGRYRTGLIFLNSIPTDKKDRDEYAEALRKKVQIEHILPRKWANYDQWDEESHNRDIDKLGNLMPLESKANIAASNEFFERKQQIYKKRSKIREALDLSEKSPSTWYPNDVKKRHNEANERLMRFFREPFGSQ